MRSKSEQQQQQRTLAHAHTASKLKFGGRVLEEVARLEEPWVRVCRHQLVDLASVVQACAAHIQRRVSPDQPSCPSALY